MQSIAKEESFSTGSILTENMEPAQSLYFITSGEVWVESPYGVVNGGKRIFAGTKGDWIGWSSLVGPGVYSGISKVIIPSKLLIFPGSSLNKAMEQDALLGYHFMRQMAIMLSKRLWGAL